jgi:uncharacterized protein YndB with AHSA1/START domain
MDTRATAAIDTSDREIAATRIFDAPRELVWRAWTDPQQIAQWWGPNGFTTTTYQMEVKPGGVWRFVMHGPDGTDYQNRITFLEVVEPERLVFRHGGGEDVEPVNHTTFVTFTDLGGRTRLDMRMLFVSPEARRFVAEKYGAVEGLDQTLGRLGNFVSGA